MTSIRRLRTRDRKWRRYLARYGAPTRWTSPMLGVQGVPGFWRNRAQLVFHPQRGAAVVAAETRRRARRREQATTEGDAA